MLNVIKLSSVTGNYPVQLGSSQAMQPSKPGNIRAMSFPVRGRNGSNYFGLNIESGSVQTITCSHVYVSPRYLSQNILDPEIDSDDKTAIDKDVRELTGNASMVYLKNVGGGHGALIAAKLEMMQPCKDRIGYSMIKDAQEKGLIIPGKTVLVEYSVGNTDIALLSMAAAMGYKLIVVMPSSDDIEKKIIVRAFGAQLRLTELPHEWTRSQKLTVMREKVKMICDKTPDTFLLDQFHSPLNPKVHYETTGPEILNGTAGKVDILVCDIVTGGTIIGSGRFLKETQGEIKELCDIAVDGTVIDSNKEGKSPIKVYGADYYPEGEALQDVDLLDGIIKVTDGEANHMVQQLALKEGLLVGLSSGRAAFAAIKLAKLPENKNKLIVAVFSDGGKGCLSTYLFEKLKEEVETLPIE